MSNQHPAFEKAFDALNELMDSVKKLKSRVDARCDGYGEWSSSKKSGFQEAISHKLKFGQSKGYKVTLGMHKRIAGNANEGDQDREFSSGFIAGHQHKPSGLK